MRQVLTKITSCILPIALTACVSNSSKPGNNISQQLNDPSAALASAATYDDQDMLSVLTHASLRRLAGDYREAILRWIVPMALMTNSTRKA